MIRYHGEPYQGSDDHANDIIRSEQRRAATEKTRKQKGLWKVVNSKNQDSMCFDEASTAVEVFEIMKKEGYQVSLIAPDGTTVNR